MPTLTSAARRAYYGGARLAAAYLGATRLAHQRTNRALDPRALSAGSTGEYQQRWGWTRSFVAKGGPSGGPASFARIVTGTGSVGGVRGFDIYGNGDGTPGTSGSWLAQPVVAGRSYTFSAWARASHVGTANNSYIVARIHDGAGAWATAFSSFAVTALGAASWVRSSCTFTAGASGFAVFRAAIDSTRWSTTDAFDLTGLLLEDSASLGPYFDGSTPRAEWTGTANASTSTLWDAG